MLPFVTQSPAQPLVTTIKEVLMEKWNRTKPTIALPNL